MSEGYEKQRMFCPNCDHDIHSYCYNPATGWYTGTCRSCGNKVEVNEIEMMAGQVRKARDADAEQGGEQGAVEVLQSSGKRELQEKGPAPTQGGGDDSRAVISEGITGTKEIRTGLYIIMTSHYPMVMTGTCASMIGNCLTLSQNHVPLQFGIFENDCYVHRVRDRGVKAFMESDLSHMIFVDNDVSCDNDTFLRMLKVALECKHDILFGAYPKRQDKAEFPIRPSLNNQMITRCSKCGSVKADWGPAGCLMISRRAIEKMVASYPTLEYNSLKVPYAGLFRFKIINDGEFENEFMGEDTAFMHRWRLLGEDIYCYPNINFGHHGFKSYWGNFEKDAIHPSMQHKPAVNRIVLNDQTDDQLSDL